MISVLEPDFLLSAAVSVPEPAVFPESVRIFSSEPDSGGLVGALLALVSHVVAVTAMNAAAKTPDHFLCFLKFNT